MPPSQKPSSSGFFPEWSEPPGGFWQRIGRRLADRAAKLRGWATEHQTAAVSLAALIVMTVTAGVLALAMMGGSSGAITPASALAALDRKDFARAVFEAEHLSRSGRGPTPQRSAAAFILGAIELNRAETSTTDMATRYALSAASYLEQSRRWGFPTARHGQGYAMLGRSQFLIGNYTEALAWLEEALSRDAAPADPLHQMAAQACLRLPSPLPRVALDHLRACIHSEDISTVDRNRAIVQQAQVQFALEDYMACRRTLESLPAKEQATGDAALLSGRLLLVEAERVARSADGETTADHKNPGSEEVPEPMEQPGDGELPMSAQIPGDDSIAPLADPAAADPVADVLRPVDESVSPEQAARQCYEQAVATFRTALLHRTTDPRLVAELHYGLAQAYYGLGDHAAALRQLRRIQSGFTIEDVAFKAALDEAELLLDRHDYAGLVNVHRQVLQRMPAVTPGSSSPLADELRQRCLVNVERLASALAFAEAVELIRASEPLLPPVERWSLLASTYEAWAVNRLAAALQAEERARRFRRATTDPDADPVSEDPGPATRDAGLSAGGVDSSGTTTNQLLGEDSERPGAASAAASNASSIIAPGSDTQAATSGEAPGASSAPADSLQPGPLWLAAVEAGQAQGVLTPGLSPRAKELVDEARECFRQAGDAYARLAEVRRPTAHYPDDLWAAAEAYRRARDYPAAIRMLRAYLEHARPHTRQPEALLRLGEVWLAEGNGEQAVQALNDVLDLYPRHPAKYAARLLLAQAYLELGEVDKAAAQLESNLEGDDLTPTSPEWRAALFALGQLKYGQQQWDQAARLLVQAVARYPEDPSTPTANYLLGECYLQQSRERAAETVPPLAVAERARADAVQGLLAKALEALNRTRQMLEQQASEGELTLLQESILRNTYFARAAVLKELGRVEESLDAYTALINRYQHSPAVLDAYVQAAAIYRQQRHIAKARNAIAAAQSVLKRLPDGGLVQDLTGQNKEQWERYLAWLAKL